MIIPASGLRSGCERKERHLVRLHFTAPHCSHMDPHMDILTLLLVESDGGGGYRISTAWFHSVLIHLRPLKLVVYECKTRRFVNYKHANVTICQNVVIKDLCTQQTVVTVRRTFQVFYCCNYLMRSKMKPLRTLN